MGRKEEQAEIERQLKVNLAIAVELKKRLSESKEKIHNHEYLEELLNCCVYASDYDKNFDRFYWVNEVSKFGNKLVWDNLVNLLDEQSELLWYKYLLFEARNYDFDSYCLYLEKNREYKDRFYQPRRKCFMKIGLIQAIQDIIDDKIDILTISLCPGSGKSTIEKFLHSAICGWYPEDFSLFYSHSGDITRMYYEGMLDILTNKEEYTWNEIFPFSKVTNTNAKQEQINIDKFKPFPNVQCTSVGAKNAGKVRASKFLLCDDLIGSIEEALNKNILDKLWNAYAVDARQRKIAGCKEIHIATRWSVHDVIGRIERMFEDSDRCRFIAVPCYDENKESNFAYDINPLTTEFFLEQEMVMDEISFRCLYMNEPIEREGLLYTEDELRRYSELPSGEPDAIIGVCDTKQKGSDFLVLPCMYKYGEDYYMEDCICTDDSDYGVQYGRMSDLIIANNMQQCEFESNAGGDRVAFEVQKQVDAKGGRCHITTKPTETNKETRIIVNADWVKKHCLFKEKESYSPKSDYATFMTWLLSYSVKGKNKHDDVPDAMANFALYATKKIVTNKVEAVFNPFRRSKI